MAQNISTSKTGDTSQMQVGIALGADQKEQVSFTGGSTISVGSNYRQDSYQSGGESYRQGNATDKQANYDEAERLADGSTGTSTDKSTSAKEGAAQSGMEGRQQQSGSSIRDGDSRLSSNEHREPHKESNEEPKEGCGGDTDIKEPFHLDIDNTSAACRAATGGWSSASLEI